jgi:hypothetical protein
MQKSSIWIRMTSLFKQLYKKWMKFSHALGLVVTSFWLTVFYFLVLMPIGIIWRIMGHDPLRLKRNKDTLSYRETSDPLNFQHMENLY